MRDPCAWEVAKVSAVVLGIVAMGFGVAVAAGELLGFIAARTAG